MPEPTALLFCPPLAPVRLTRELPLVLGRSRDCGLTIRREDASRRHAEVRYRDGRFVVRDLGSTNGTFVNGVAATEETPLAAGDQIEIGSAHITFCLVQGGGLEALAQEPIEESTVLFDRAAAREIVKGDFAEIPPFAVLQMLEMGRKSGLLTVDAEAGPMRLWLGDGQPVHAEAGGETGFDAALVVVGLERGAFRFETQVDPPSFSIETSCTEILLEATRRLDEAGS
ncbi:MAG: DUF4388 domain-containing protein [Proteobacteria bacterium]|nr:DUF4388 domain-containing protein [Pseudomonadota bacterium]